MADGLAPARLTDASALFAAFRHPADEAELALTAHAEAMAKAAFAGIETTDTSAPLVSALDGALRLQGAEEVLIAIAPDLDRDARFIRPEADIAFGERAAVQLSLAYKGHWIRVTHTLDRDGIDAESPRSLVAVARRGDPRGVVEKRGSRGPPAVMVGRGESRFEPAFRRGRRTEPRRRPAGRVGRVGDGNL